MEHSIIKRERVRFGAPATAAAGRPKSLGAPPPACTPGGKAELVRLGDLVRGIEVTCPCGEVTLVEIELAGAERAPAGDAGQVTR